MKHKYLYMISLIFFSFMGISDISQAANSYLPKAINQLLSEYQSQGAVAPDSNNGKQLWQKKNLLKGQTQARSCSACHTNDLTRQGKHVRTGKKIAPMAPSRNPQRLTKIKKIKKWLKRNCKWTMGRECTAQEKSDILAYISQQ